MTGRELIIYILSNNLEDKQVIENGKLIGHTNDIDLAVKFDVGKATIGALINTGAIPAFKLGDTWFIPNNVRVDLKEKYVICLKDCQKR